MSTRSHTHRVELPCSADEAFAALITPSAICRWWQARRAVVLARPGGFWTACWGEDEDRPDYICGHAIGRYEPGRVLELKNTQYFSRHGALPFDADIVATFTVSQTDTGAIVEVQQDGFPTDPIADEFYAACEQGWRDTLEGLRKFLTKP